MFGARQITRLVLDEFIVDDANAVAGQYRQDFAVTRTLRSQDCARYPGKMRILIAAEYGVEKRIQRTSWMLLAREYGVPRGRTIATYILSTSRAPAITAEERPQAFRPV
jgi:hypothetical protein